MGTPMSKNLLKAGYELTVYDLVDSQVKQLVNLGAKAASSPAEVARQSEVVITMLTNDQIVKDVVMGPAGIAEGASGGMIYIDSSTISPVTSKLMAKEMAKIGVEMLDAPVTGTKPHAIAGTLTYMVGGKTEIYEKCLPILQSMGSSCFHMGANGAGSYSKLCNNTIASINMVAFAEGLVMATKAGIDPKLFVEVISRGGARSGQIENKAPKIIARDFQPNFPILLSYKDAGLAGEIARELNIPTPALAIAREMLNMAIAQGYGSEDTCAVVKCYEEWAHTQVGK